MKRTVYRNCIISRIYLWMFGEYGMETESKHDEDKYFGITEKSPKTCKILSKHCRNSGKSFIDSFYWFFFFLPSRSKYILCYLCLSYVYLCAHIILVIKKQQRNNKCQHLWCKINIKKSLNLPYCSSFLQQLHQACDLLCHQVQITPDST